ncbi:MAG: hypothetical protein R3B96_08860 [Pirellulaceae bacterium]
MTGSLQLPAWFSLDALRGKLRAAPGLAGRGDNRPTLFIGWDRRSLSFVIIEKGKQGPRRLEFGRLERQADIEPIIQVRDHLNDRVRVGAVVVVLSRADLEATELTLPPAEESEVSTLVQSQIEEGLSEGESLPVIDYLELGSSAEGNRQVTAYVAGSDLIQRLRDACDQSRWRLAAVVPRGLGPWGLIADNLLARWPAAVAVTLLDGEVEWLVLRDSKIERQRTVRVGSDESDLLGDQIWTEIQRSFAMSGEPNLEPHLIAFGEPKRIAELTGPLLSRFRDDVSVVQPFQVIGGSVGGDAQDQHVFAPLIGAAKLFFERRLPVDLIRPKSPPKAVHPMRRWAPIAGLAVVALLVLTYVMRSDVVALQTEYDQKKSKLDQDEKVANKQAERADIARVVDAWRADEVNWLEPLQQLSEKLPEGRAATVRRLTGASTADSVVFDLSVQVDDESTVAAMENAIRGPEVSVTSRRVAERAAGTDYPWQFETQVVFSREAVPIPEPPEIDDLDLEADQEPDPADASGESEQVDSATNEAEQEDSE